MQRNCPHCGQHLVIAEEDIVAPWVFTKCHACAGLSVIRKETHEMSGATARATPTPKGKASAVLRRRESAPARASKVIERSRLAEAQAGAGPAFQRAEPVRLEGRAITGGWSGARLPP